MLKAVSFKLQVRANCKKDELEFAKLDRSRIRPNRLRITKIKFCIIFKSGPSPREHLGFQSNFSTYKRETLAMFCKLFGRLVCYSLWDQRSFVPYNYTRVYRSKIYTQAVVEPSCCYKDQQLKVIWNLWVGSQSHMRGCLCCIKSKKKRSPWIRSLHVIVSVSYYLR